jgi:hypothetical protein
MSDADCDCLCMGFDKECFDCLDGDYSLGYSEGYYLPGDGGPDGGAALLDVQGGTEDYACSLCRKLNECGDGTEDLCVDAAQKEPGDRSALERRCVALGCCSHRNIVHLPNAQ